jgi:hypothetical protein
MERKMSPMNHRKIVAALAVALAASTLAACSQTAMNQEAAAERTAGELDEQTCLQAVVKQTGDPQAQVVKSTTDFGASEVVVQAGPQGSLWKCTINGGVLKGINSVSRLSL